MLLLIFSDSGTAPPPYVTQSPRASRWRSGYRVQDVIRMLFLFLGF